MVARRLHGRRRRAVGVRAKIVCSARRRFAVRRSRRHFYVQLLSSDGGEVLASASTLSRRIKDVCAEKTKSETAAFLGEVIAGDILKLGVKEVAFDRGGFRYHGHVKEIAEAARAAGLSF